MQTRRPPLFIISDIECARPHAPVDDCRYRVAWSINPHMQVGAVDFARARQEHATFREALEAAGATVASLPFVHGAFDSVFAKDSAILVRRGKATGAVLASPRFAERHREQSARMRELEQLGFDVMQASSATWEGGDVIVLPSHRIALLGYGHRSELAAARWLEVALEMPVVPLRLVDPYLYHLDTALAVLPDGTALACEDAFSPDAVRALHGVPGITSVHGIPRDEAVAFGLNLVAVGSTLILGGSAPAVEAVARRRGYDVAFVPLTQFHLAGGSGACLVAQVHDFEVATQAQSEVA